jgi:hypothetical protein
MITILIKIPELSQELLTIFKIKQNCIINAVRRFRYYFKITTLKNSL